MVLTYTNFPHDFNALASSTAPKKSFLVFYSDVVDGQMWCPDCRAVEPVIKNAFDGADKPNALIVWVGDRPRWRDSSNPARMEWGVNSVPTIVRLEEGRETGRLVEDEILDKAKLAALIGN